MKNNFLIIISLLSIIFCEFTIKSDDFENESMLDKKFTPYGEDVNPSLKWSNPPEGTQSYALICEDPDCPSGLFTHWAIKNIPKETKNIESGKKIGVEIRNSWGLKRYKGPRPPSGIHRYYFKLYACKVEKMKANTLQQFYDEIEKVKLCEPAVVMGKFSH